MRRIGTVLAAATLLGGTLAVGAPPATAAPSTGAGAGHIRWTACDDETLQEYGAVCGTLVVPLDHARPDGPTVELAVSMVRHTVPAARYQGIMLTNPGGPGGSGLGLSILGAFVPGTAAAAYDWIGFDPRGVGASRPALSCLPNYFGPDRPDYVPSTPALERTWLNRSARYAAACGAKGGALLDHMTTRDVAQDMDALRAALGQRQVNYFGFSYGTYLGQVYATLYPQRVRRMVLDSNVDPRFVWYQANLHQDVAFDRNITIWFGWLARYDAVYHLGRTAAAVEKRWYAEQDRLRARPAAGIVGPDEFADVFLYAGYYQVYWTWLADVFAGWANHRDAGPLVDAYYAFDGPGDDNLYAVYNAVQCTDVQWPTSWARWRRDNWRTYDEAPFFTWGNAWFNAPCLTWPAKAHRPVQVDGSRVGSVLLVGETLDAATPFSGSLEVRRRFPHAVLIGEPGGTTHAGTLYGNACVDDRIAAYLQSGALPARRSGDRADLLCAPLPQPVPDQVAAAPAGQALAMLRASSVAQ